MAVSLLPERGVLVNAPAMAVRLPAIFDRASSANHSYVDAVDGRTQVVAEGSVRWVGVGGAGGAPATFSFLSALLATSTAIEVVAAAAVEPLDVSPDSVDGLPAHELYVMRDGAVLQPRLHALLGPALGRLERYVNAERCPPPMRCTACTSLLRRYRAEDRESHPEHVDGHAAVTAVTALSDARGYVRSGLLRHSRHPTRPLRPSLPGIPAACSSPT